MAKPLFDTTESHHVNLLETCPVVDGSIVSKTLIDTGALKQILFAMDAEQEISEHKAPYVATVEVLEGKLAFAIEGDRRSMTAHDWVVMPPNAPHDLRAEQATRFLLTLVKGE